MKTIPFFVMLFLCAITFNCTKGNQDLKLSMAYSEQSHEAQLVRLMYCYENCSSSNEKQKSREVIADLIFEIKDLYGSDIAIKLLEGATNKQLAIQFNLELSYIKDSNYSQSSDLPCYRYWKSEIDAAIVDVFGCVDSPPNILDSISCFGAFLDRIVAANHVFTDCMKQYEIN